MWRDLIDLPKEDGLVQVLCQVMPDAEEEPVRSCHLAVSTGDHATGDLFVSIGYPVFDDELDNAEDGWQVAGWCMTQDCWMSARRYAVLGWQPLASTENPPSF